MAMTIPPTVSGTRNKWFLDSAAFFVGGVLGASASLGAVAATLGFFSLFMDRRLLAEAVMLLGSVVMLRDLGVKVPVPYRSHQVPEQWRSVLPVRVALLVYGAVLGFGFATPFTSSAHLVVLLAFPFMGSVGLGLVSALVLAFGKAIVLYLAQGMDSYEGILCRIEVRELNGRLRLLSRRLATLGASIIVLLTLAHGVWG